MAILPPPQPYVWNVYIPGETVAFGVPDTDDRGLRIDCNKSRIYVRGPIAAEFGQRISFKISSKAGTRTFHSTVQEAGDGANFSVEVKASDDIITTLMAGLDIRILADGGNWVIPGKGAAAVLGPLLKVCGAPG